MTNGKWYTVEGVAKFGHGFEVKLRLVQGGSLNGATLYSL